MPEQHSEEFGNIPNDSENFGTLPHNSESFRTIRNNVERTAHHTLTVREVVRLFEQAGVPRTERSIINWCQPNRQGIARLDAFLDENARKYFVTPESVTRAIQEEQSKQAAGEIPIMHEKKIPNASEEKQAPKTASTASGNEMESIERKVRDLEITNRVKDQFIGMLEKDRERLVGEREGYVRELMSQSRHIGELETRLLQLGAPIQPFELPKDSENENR